MPPQSTPLEQTPPQNRPPPWGRYPPDQTPPPGADTPPGADHPPEQTPPGEQTPSQEQMPPPVGSRLQHTVYERPVRILLECILVFPMSLRITIFGHIPVIPVAFLNPRLRLLFLPISSQGLHLCKWKYYNENTFSEMKRCMEYYNETFHSELQMRL